MDFRYPVHFAAMTKSIRLQQQIESCESANTRKPWSHLRRGIFRSRQGQRNCHHQDRSNRLLLLFEKGFRDSTVILREVSMADLDTIVNAEYW